jgi:hypothetical protein
MRVQLVREGCSVAAKARVIDPTWRTWAYEQAQGRVGVRTNGHVAITVQATARDKRSVPEVVGCLATIEAVLDGLKAGGLLRDTRGELVELRVRQPAVTGVDGLVLDITDVQEPF